MTALSILATDASAQAALASVAGAAVGLGGILLTAIWLHYLYR